MQPKNTVTYRPTHGTAYATARPFVFQVGNTQHVRMSANELGRLVESITAAATDLAGQVVTAADLKRILNPSPEEV